MTDDPTAAWVAEGAEIPRSDADLDEIVVTPRKVAGPTIISRELAEDSTPAATQVVGDGLPMDIATKVDSAFFNHPPLGRPWRPWSRGLMTSVPPTSCSCVLSPQ